jgi:mannose-1-phosphate guanylyltransferase/CheY-like chemotaxis protein
LAPIAHTESRMTTNQSVLLVESGPPSVLRAALERAGFRVIWTRGGVDALTVAAACDDVTAIVMDGAGAQGFDLVTYLRHRFPDAPLVFLGAPEMDIAEESARGGGATACLRQPVGPAVVVAAVASAMLGAATDEFFSAGAAGSSRVLREPAPLWGIVLAGGEGRRMLPLVHEIHGEARPKQYATLLGGRSLLGATLDRVRLGIPLADTVVVALKRHRRFIDSERAAGEVPTVILQPADRGTAAGVLLPARCILAREPRATVAVFPSDHYVEPAARFMAHVGDAARFVDHHPDRIVLVGVEPTDAETEYGWAEPGESLGRSGESEFWSVSRFVEKPTARAARACLGQGGLWNTFVLVARATTLMEAAREVVPLVQERLESVVPFLGGSWEAPALRRAYAAMPNASLSASLLERCTARLAVSRLAGVRWCDWGSPRRVVRHLQAEGLRPDWLERFLASRLA